MSQTIPSDRNLRSMGQAIANFFSPIISIRPYEHFYEGDFCKSFSRLRYTCYLYEEEEFENALYRILHMNPKWWSRALLCLSKACGSSNLGVTTFKRIWMRDKQVQRRRRLRDFCPLPLHIGHHILRVQAHQTISLWSETTVWQPCSQTRCYARSDSS